MQLFSLGGGGDGGLLLPKKLCRRVSYYQIGLAWSHTHSNIQLSSPLHVGFSGNQNLTTMKET